VINSEKNRINKVLSNAEIQAMITAIGTGIGDEFDIANLRYNRVIVMTDADQDGSHIRTLILTFLYRQMPELVERGHVYIAVPPLYLVKLGNQQMYLEKDSQLEDLLVRERVKDMQITTRDASTANLTEARYHRFLRALNEFDGWSARLRSDFGREAADFVIAHRLAETEAESIDAAVALLNDMPANGYELAVVESSEGSVRVRVVERDTGAASHVVVPSELLASPIYANVRKAYGRLAEIVGLPPFELTFGKKRGRAETFEGLREKALALAKEGIQVSRFKGLGEMNPEQLWETTMDPARRTLIRVEVEDASAADRVFSTLMGDQVEPRREFIEANAQDVRFLDV
jgi:DNA gyrase subunit B